MNLGPVMLDIAGTTLDDNDRRRLMHRQVGGVILFSRNYESPAQLKALTEAIHSLRMPRLVVAVDQEGGRVQRFREDFQKIPAMARLGDLYNEDSGKAIQSAETIAWVMAAELLHYGVDVSFSPVLDIGNQVSQVIGDRAFHHDPESITRLANAWIRGMRKAGMEAVGKHFPGHGSVEGDSHHVMPFDRRSFDKIEALDLVPFRRVIATHLSGIMMAHVIYDQVDDIAAGYSRRWIRDILRRQLGFDGIIFSDDLTMSGAESVGGYAERAKNALQAGCDILLVCNNPEGADEVLESLGDYDNPTSQIRMIRLHGRPPKGTADLFNTRNWQQAVKLLDEFNQQASVTESGDFFE
ncbi:MAG: beta-N-acetylhexosaminidase [Gammaproteobacteria bacterium]|nr:beta-N-acetylhexosaminidase [Gammaproteobacteria bacterium]